jgi:hypothetical protein
VFKNQNPFDKSKGQIVTEVAVGFVILFFIACVVYLGAKTTMDASMAEAGNVLESLTLTDHALQKVLTDTWNVAAITTWMELGRCHPVDVYTCKGGVTKYTCPLDEGKTGKNSLYIGIIVGNATGTELVITGFIAPRKTWDKLGQRDGCTKSVWFMPSDWVLP